MTSGLCRKAGGYLYGVNRYGSWHHKDGVDRSKRRPIFPTDGAGGVALAYLLILDLLAQARYLFCSKSMNTALAISALAEGCGDG
jgi:hypothetical protein